MSKAKEDLKAIMDLLAEIREEHRFSTLSVSIYPDGNGYAYNLDSDDDSLDCIIRGEYGSLKEKEERKNESV